MSDNSKKETYEIPKKEFVGQVDKSKKFSGWYYDDQQRLFDAGRLTTISLHANSIFVPRSHENGMQYSEWFYDTPILEGEDAERLSNYYPFGNYIRDGESAKASNNMTVVHSRGYFYEPLCTAVVSEDVAVGITNAWSEMGGDMIGGLWRNVQQFAPYAASMTESIGGIVEEVTSSFLKGKVDDKGNLLSEYKNSVLTAPMVHVASHLNALSRIAQDPETHDTINDYLNRSLVMQGTRFSYYQGTGVNFNNMVMKFTIFPTWKYNKNTSQMEFITVPAQISKLYPYFVGEYIDESAANALRDGLGGFVGWEMPPGGFRAALKDIDNVQKGTLKLKIGSLYSISNLVVESVMMNFSKEVVKCPDPKFFVTKEPVTDDSGNKTFKDSKSVYGLVTPLYCEITLQLKPATKYSSQSLRRFFDSSNMSQEVYETELGMINTLWSGVQKYRERFITTESMSKENKIKLNEKLNSIKVDDKSKDNAKISPATHLNTNANSKISEENSDNERASNIKSTTLEDYRSMSRYLEETYGKENWSQLDEDQKKALVLHELTDTANTAESDYKNGYIEYLKADEQIKGDYEKYPKKDEVTYDEYVAEISSNPEYSKKYAETLISSDNYEELNEYNYNNLFKKYADERNKENFNNLVSKYTNDKDFSEKAKNAYNELDEETKKTLTYEDYFKKRVEDECRENNTLTVETTTVDFNNFLCNSNFISYSEAERANIASSRDDALIEELKIKDNNFSLMSPEEQRVQADIYRKKIESTSKYNLLNEARNSYMYDDRSRTLLDWELASDDAKNKYMMDYVTSDLDYYQTKVKDYSIIDDLGNPIGTGLSESQALLEISKMSKNALEKEKLEVAKSYGVEKYEDLDIESKKKIDELATYQLAKKLVEEDPEFKFRKINEGYTDTEDFLIKRYSRIDEDCIDKIFIDKYIKINTEEKKVIDNGVSEEESSSTATNYYNFAETTYNSTLTLAPELKPEGSTEIIKTPIDYSTSTFTTNLLEIQSLENSNNPVIVEASKTSNTVEEFMDKINSEIEKIINSYFDPNKYTSSEREEAAEQIKKKMSKLYTA